MATTHPTRPAPRTFEALAEDWTPFIRGFGVRCGIRPTDLDDFMQEVLLDVIERDELDEYDPKLGKFSSWLGGLVYRKAQSFRTRSQRFARELTLNAPAYSEAGATLEIQDFVVDAYTDHVMAELESLGNVTAMGNRLRVHGSSDAFRLFEALVQELYEPQVSDYRIHGSDERRINRKRLAARVGIPASKLTRALDDLGSELRKLGFA